MELKIIREELLKGLSIAQGISDARGTMPILANFLLEATSTGINIVATDLQVSTKCSYLAEIKAEGSVTLNTRKVYDIVRELPPQDIYISTGEGDWVSISCQTSNFRLPGLPAQDFPSLPKVEQRSLSRCNQGIFLDMIRKTIFAAAADQTRYALNGVLFEASSDTACMVTTDGHRLAYIERKLDEKVPEKVHAIIPRKALQEAFRMFAAVDSPILFGAGGNHAFFRSGELLLFSRLLEGQFPNYRQVIADSHDKNLIVEKNPFMAALRRVSILSDEKTKMVKMFLKKGQLTLISSDADKGEAKEELAVNYEGDDIAIGFNARYLLDPMGAIDEERVLLRLKDETTSCCLSPENVPYYKCVVMPMRI